MAKHEKKTLWDDVSSFTRDWTQSQMTPNVLIVCQSIIEPGTETLVIKPKALQWKENREQRNTQKLTQGAPTKGKQETKPDVVQHKALQWSE